MRTSICVHGHRTVRSGDRLGNCARAMPRTDCSRFSSELRWLPRTGRRGLSSARRCPVQLDGQIRVLELAQIIAGPYCGDGAGGFGRGCGEAGSTARGRSGCASGSARSSRPATMQAVSWLASMPRASRRPRSSWTSRRSAAGREVVALGLMRPISMSSADQGLRAMSACRSGCRRRLPAAIAPRRFSTPTPDAILHKHRLLGTAEARVARRGRRSTRSAGRKTGFASMSG